MDEDTLEKIKANNEAGRPSLEGLTEDEIRAFGKAAIFGEKEDE